MDILFHAIETVKSKAKRTDLYPIKAGQYLICTDSGDIYYDTTDGTRKHLTDIIDVSTEAGLNAILAPLDKIYFAKDTGHFYRYIDDNWMDLSKMASKDNSKSIYITLAADNWVEKQQAVAVEGLAADHNGVIGLPSNISGIQMEAARDAELYLSGHEDGNLTIAAYSIVPKIDIPVVLVLFN